MSTTTLKIKRKSDGKILTDVINDTCQVHNIYDGDKLMVRDKDYNIGYVEGEGFLDWADYEEATNIDNHMKLPKSQDRERYVKVLAKLKTWTVVEDVIEFDTDTQSFIIPSGYQVDTKVISWEYYKD